MGFKVVGIPWTTIGYAGRLLSRSGEKLGSQASLWSRSLSAWLAVVVYTTMSLDRCRWADRTWMGLVSVGLSLIFAVVSMLFRDMMMVVRS